MYGSAKQGRSAKLRRQVCCSIVLLSACIEVNSLLLIALCPRSKVLQYGANDTGLLQYTEVAACVTVSSCFVIIGSCGHRCRHHRRTSGRSLASCPCVIHVQRPIQEVPTTAKIWQSTDCDRTRKWKRSLAF
jgi:hypothetical protein